MVLSMSLAVLSEYQWYLPFPSWYGQGECWRVTKASDFINESNLQELAMEECRVEEANTAPISLGAHDFLEFEDEKQIVKVCVRDGERLVV